MGQSIGIRIDPQRKHPLHRQIFDEVVARIEAKAFPPGYRLPPSRVLARELGAHRNTVARAYSELESAGFVSSNVGRGTFVQKPTAAAPALGRICPGTSRPHALELAVLERRAQ